MKELVFKGKDNQALTSSLLVAEKFGKRHAEVLDAVRELIAKTENSTFVENLENPLKVAPLIQSNLTPVKFFHSFILFILVFFVFFLSVMPGSTLNFVYKYNDSFLLLHLRSDSPKSSIRIA